MATAPNSPYSASKAGSDLLALAYHRTHGLDVAVTRCSNNYGPYQFPEKVVPLFITHLIDGRTVPLYGDGSNIRDRLHVTDHCRGIDLVLHGGRAGEIYHIGGGTELSNHKLTGLLLDAVGAGWDRVEYVADRKGQDLRYSLDDGKIREHLGYAPQVAFTDGLAATVAGGSRSRRGRSCGDLVPAGDRCTRAAHPGRAGRAVRGGGHRRERHGRPTPRTRARTVAHSCCTSPPTTCSRERVVA